MPLHTPPFVVVEAPLVVEEELFDMIRLWRCRAAPVTLIGRRITRFVGLPY